MQYDLRTQLFYPAEIVFIPYFQIVVVRAMEAPNALKFVVEGNQGNAFS